MEEKIASFREPEVGESWFNRFFEPRFSVTDAIWGSISVSTLVPSWLKGAPLALLIPIGLVAFALVTAFAHTIRVDKKVSSKAIILLSCIAIYVLLSGDTLKPYVAGDINHSSEATMWLAGANRQLLIIGVILALAFISILWVLKNSSPTETPFADQSEAVDLPIADSVALQALRTELERCQADLARANSMVSELTNERESQTKRTEKVLELRTVAERMYGQTLRGVLESDKQEGDHYRCIKVAMMVLKDIAGRPANSVEQVKDTRLLFEQTKIVLNTLPQSITGAALLMVSETISPTWEMKQFASFNEEHNKMLNEIAYDVERLGVMLPGYAKKSSSSN